MWRLQVAHVGRWLSPTPPAAHRDSDFKHPGYSLAGDHVGGDARRGHHDGCGSGVGVPVARGPEPCVLVLHSIRYFVVSGSVLIHEPSKKSSTLFHSKLAPFQAAP